MDFLTSGDPPQDVTLISQAEYNRRVRALRDIVQSLDMARLMYGSQGEARERFFNELVEMGIPESAAVELLGPPGTQIRSSVLTAQTFPSLDTPAPQFRYDPLPEVPRRAPARRPRAGLQTGQKVADVAVVEQGANELVTFTVPTTGEQPAGAPAQVPANNAGDAGRRR